MFAHIGRVTLKNGSKTQNHEHIMEYSYIYSYIYIYNHHDDLGMLKNVGMGHDFPNHGILGG